MQEFQGAQEAGDARPGIVGGDGVGESRQDRAAALEQENRALRETVQAQAGELEELNRRLAELGSRDGFWVWTVRLTAIKTARGLASAPAEAQFAQCRGGYVGGVFRRGTRLRPATPLVAEWRQLRTILETAGSGIDRARSVVRRWDLEAVTMGEYHLILRRRRAKGRPCATAAAGLDRSTPGVCPGSAGSV